MKKDFIPVTLSELNDWETNFKNKLPEVAKVLNIPDGEVKVAISFVEAHQTAYGQMLDGRKTAKSLTSKNREQSKTAIDEVRRMAGSIKSAKGYTEAMGQTLGIIGIDTFFDKAESKPSITADQEGNLVVVRFNKNKADGVNIYSRRSGEKDFSFLAVDTVPPYHDKRPNLVPGQAETREYKAWYFMDEDIIGRESDVVSITV